MKAVEWLLNEFTIRYGAALMASQWNGLKPDDVKLHWARELATMPRRNVEYALRYLPDMPPKASEFAALCRRCPPETYRALPHVLSEEEKEHNRARLAALKARMA